MITVIEEAKLFSRNTTENKRVKHNINKPTEMIIWQGDHVIIEAKMGVGKI